ncbi:MAG: hypothetical protein FWC65_00100 [Treponema sp.]|nr:hypothetical protein [Treponema sp.]
MVKRISVCVSFILWAAFFAGCDLQQAPPEEFHARAPGSVISLQEVADYTFYIWESGVFELPLAGATGWAAINLPMHIHASDHTDIIATLPPGQGFTIVRADHDWWYIEAGASTGWVMNRFCMINLPDILPSIVYNITNSTHSLFRSSGRYIPNITGRALYRSRDFNARLGREKYIAPVLFGMAPKIAAAQQAALADGNTLIIYEAFRPADAHNAVHDNLLHLYDTDPVIRAGISTPPWNIRWFLAVSPYNHQRGTAIDVSLGRIDYYQIRVTGDYAFIHISGFTPYTMQTPMHELSIAAVVFTSPVHARSTTAWREAVFSSRATPGTILLHRYMTDAGLVPLASEWWHFNDLVHTELAIEADITGEFSLDRTHSRPPILRR